MRALKAKHPDEVRLISIADPHLAVSSPLSWKADYRLVTEGAIEQVFNFGLKQEVDAYVWAGDIFHRKSTLRNPLGFVADCIRFMRRGGVPNLAVAGNHDLRWGSITGLPGQPLELLIEAGAVQLLDTEETMIQAQDFNVQVAGASFEQGKATGCAVKRREPGVKWLISVGHFWFGMKDGILGGEQVFGLNYFHESDPDVFIIGHKHEDLGVVEEGGKKFVAVGAITLTGEKLSDEQRRPAAAYIVLRKEGTDVRILRPKTPAFTELINLEKREQVMRESAALEEFVDTISAATLSGTDPRAILAELDPGQEVRERAEKYLLDAEQRLGV